MLLRTTANPFSGSHSKMAQKVKSVLELAQICQSGASSSDDWTAFNRIFKVTMSSNRMIIPKPFSSKVSRWFKLPTDTTEDESFRRAENQTVVRVFDRWTCNQTCFNAARACKPLNNGLALDRQQSLDCISTCDFCTVREFTGEDTWGRLENDSAVTASNVAKYDAFHGMAIFKDHPPTHYSQQKLFDVVDLCVEWFEKTHKHHPEAIYPIFNWNCRARAGASQHHGHTHMLLGKDFHYGQWERLSQVSKLYATSYPGNNYFEDLITAQNNLGLAHKVGNAWILANLVPYCGYEFKVISWSFDKDFKLALHKAIDALLHEFGSKTFNCCIQMPPLLDGKLQGLKCEPDAKRAKKDTCISQPMPYIANLIDRGDPTTGTSSDICGMRIYGSAIVNVDPFSLAQCLGWSNDSSNLR